MINISKKRKYLFSRYLIQPISFLINHNLFKIEFKSNNKPPIFQPKSFPFSKVSLNSRSVTKHFVLETYYVELRLSYPTNSLSILLPATEITPFPPNFCSTKLQCDQKLNFWLCHHLLLLSFPLLDSRNLNLCETHVRGLWR